MQNNKVLLFRFGFFFKDFKKSKKSKIKIISKKMKINLNFIISTIRC